MMYVIFKEEVVDSGGFKTTFMFPHSEQPNTMRVTDLITELNDLIPPSYKERIKIRALKVGDYDVDFTSSLEGIYIVARARKTFVEEVLDAYTDDMTNCVTLLNRECQEPDVKYVGQWIRGNLC